MLESFLIKPFITLILVAISSSILGVFVLWKKLSYFGDALSHATLLGLIFGFIFKIDQILILMIFSCLFAFLTAYFTRNQFFNKNTIIVIISYFCVALAMVLNDIFTQNFDFNSYIFGDILTVENLDLQILILLSVVIVFYTFFAFKKILLINTNQDLARIEGIKVEYWNISFLILLSLTIALSVRFVGVFLMTALLILPAAIARIFSNSARQMMILSLAISVVISSLSFKFALDYNLTAAPAVITVFGIIFLTSLVLKRLLIFTK